MGDAFCNPAEIRECSAQTVSCESAQKKSAVGLKRAVQVAVDELVLAQVGHHSEADLVFPERKLNGNPSDLNLPQGFLLW